MPQPARKTANLRIGRISAPSATYFVTACTAHRHPVFEGAEAAHHAIAAVRRLVEDVDVIWIVATVMPDHIHLLLELTGRLTLAQVAGKVKAHITRAMKPDKALWQENIFEHRLRAAERTEAYAFYVFMNPYRAALRPITEPWPHWYCSDRNRFAFLESIDAHGAPPAAWMNWDETLDAALTTGE